MRKLDYNLFWFHRSNGLRCLKWRIYFCNYMAFINLNGFRSIRYSSDILSVKLLWPSHPNLVKFWFCRSWGTPTLWTSSLSKIRVFNSYIVLIKMIKFKTSGAKISMLVLTSGTLHKYVNIVIEMLQFLVERSPIAKLLICIHWDSSNFFDTCFRSVIDW